MKICSCCNESVEVLHIKNPPTCNKCYKPPKKICKGCGKLDIVKKKIDGWPVCNKCYEIDYIPKYNCCVCGRNKKSQKTIDNLHYCSKCYKSDIQPKYECSVCGEIAIVNTRDDKERPICPSCYKNPIEMCYICNEEKEVWCRRDGKPYCMVCNSAYKHKNDPQFHIRENLRRRLKSVLDKYSIDGKTHSSKKYGINYSAIIEHLGLCPGNMENYHIDHIFPLVAFDLNNLLHIKAAFAPENHQWLIKEENMSKGCKYNKIAFEEYLREHGC